jgi:hypothetical protein
VGRRQSETALGKILGVGSQRFLDASRDLLASCAEGHFDRLWQSVTA